MQPSVLMHGRSQDFFREGDHFSKILKRFLRKLIKMHYFSIFFIIFNKACVNFSRIWTKNANVGKFWEDCENFWWKFYRKIEFLFYFYFGKFARKNRAFGNNNIFIQQFFRFREIPPPPSPGYALGLMLFYSVSMLLSKVTDYSLANMLSALYGAQNYIRPWIKYRLIWWICEWIKEKFPIDNPSPFRNDMWKMWYVKHSFPLEWKILIYKRNLKPNMFDRGKKYCFKPATPSGF